MLSAMESVDHLNIIVPGENVGIRANVHSERGLHHSQRNTASLWLVKQHGKRSGRRCLEFQQPGKP